MKRILLVLTALVLALGCLGGALGEESTEKKHVSDYDICETVEGLLECGEMALEDGMPAKQVLEEMYAIADAGNFLEQYEATCENIAAYENKTYKKLQEYLGYENQSQALDVILTPAAEDSDSGWSAYACPDVSDAMRKALKDSAAQYCFEPSYWAEEDFKTVLGNAYSKFVPSRPRPAYACVIIKKGAQCWPETAWNKGDNTDFLNAMNEIVNSIAIQLDEDAPVFTGNPHLASTYWIFDVDYEFYSWYGDKEIKGYNLSMTLTVRDAAGKKDAAQLKYSEKLPSTIYSWYDGISCPDFPDPYEISNLDATVNKIRALMQKQRGEAAASRKITAMNAEKVLNGILGEQAGKIEDPWQKAIWECGAKDVELSGDTISFTLRSYNPDVKGLGAYKKAKDKAEWLNSALENAAKYDLAATLALENGQPTSKSISALKKQVKAAATASKEAFAGDDISAAILDRLFPTPAAGKTVKAEQLLTPDESFLAWLESSRDYRLSGQDPANLSTLFASQKSKTLETKNGPTALAVTLTAADPAALLQDASKAVLDKMAYLIDTERDTDSLEETLRGAAADAAIAAKKNAKTKYEIPVDLNQLLDGDYSAEYWAYIEAYTFNDAVYSLRRSIENLPAFAAESFPKNGIMSGGKSGTEVTIKLPKDSNPTYMQIRKSDTDELACTLFLHPGKSVTLHLRKGFYRLYYCSGPYWYDEDELFGDLGAYSKSEPTEIKGTDYTHTITLQSTKDGGTSIYGANKEEFIKP